MGKDIGNHILNRVVQDSMQQLRVRGRLILIYHGVILAAFLGIWIIGSGYSFDFGLITRDPAQLLGFHPLIGIISDFGILMWCSTAAICFFVFALSKQYAEKSFRGFLLTSAFLTLFLLLDDLFLIHEILGPEYLHIKQNYFYAIYFFVFLGYLVNYYKVILRTEFVLLGMAFAYFGISIIMDYIAGKFGIEINTLFEDAFKFLGIMLWFLYLVRICVKVVSNRAGRENQANS